MAYHERRIDDINRAKEILALAEKGASDEDAIAAQYGGMEVLNEILGQLRGDAITPKEEPTVSVLPPIPRQIVMVNGANEESEVAELQPVPFLTGMGSNGNGHK